MTRKTFNYICSLVISPSMEDTNNYTFIDGRVLCLEDRVAVALRRLYSSETIQTLGSSVGASESTILLITERFVASLCERARHHVQWPVSSEMDNIKSMFDKIHSMRNCCGIICSTTHITFGQNCDNEKDDCIRMQVVIDPNMRFMGIELEQAGGTLHDCYLFKKCNTGAWLNGSRLNKLSILQDSLIFKQFEKGAWLNGSKLIVALDGSEVGEYIIGDAGYPLLPWLLTPYQEEDLSEAKAEFNRRHSAATTCAMKALARFQDTWKYLQRERFNSDTLEDIIYACCILHNIVIEMEDDTAMPSLKKGKYCKEVRQLASEDAVSTRDMLSQYFLASRSSESGGSEDKGKEQEVQTRTTEDERQC